MQVGVFAASPSLHQKNRISPPTPIEQKCLKSFPNKRFGRDKIVIVNAVIAVKQNGPMSFRPTFITYAVKNVNAL